MGGGGGGAGGGGGPPPNMRLNGIMQLSDRTVFHPAINAQEALQQLVFFDDVHRPATVFIIS
jgi:hypothetical protein